LTPRDSAVSLFWALQPRISKINSFMIEFVRNNHKIPNKIVSHRHTNSTRQGCFLVNVSAASAETRVSRFVHLSEQSHVGQNSNSDWWITHFKTSLLPILSVCVCAFRIPEKGSFYDNKKHLSWWSVKESKIKLSVTRAINVCAACTFKRIIYWRLQPSQEIWFQ